MGISILIGSFIGGYGSKLMSEGTINVVYGILAALAAIIMFVPKKGIDDIPLDKVIFNKWLVSRIGISDRNWLRDCRGGGGVPSRSCDARDSENSY